MEGALQAGTLNIWCINWWITQRSSDFVGFLESILGVGDFVHFVWKAFSNLPVNILYNEL